MTPRDYLMIGVVGLSILFIIMFIISFIKEDPSTYHDLYIIKIFKRCYYNGLYDVNKIGCTKCKKIWGSTELDPLTILPWSDARFIKARSLELEKDLNESSRTLVTDILNKAQGKI